MHCAHLHCVQGTCMLKGNFKARSVEIMLSTLQAALLLLFNEAEVLTHSEVQERLNLPEEDVTRLLHSLSCAKYKLLLKEPAGRTISKTDKFSFNADFTDRMKRIKVPLPPVDEKKKVGKQAVNVAAHATRSMIELTAGAVMCTTLLSPQWPALLMQVMEDVDKDRRHAIDAAIVRTMKSRKVLAHQQLMLEVVGQLTRMFKPDFKQIKKVRCSCND